MVDIITFPNTDAGRAQRTDLIAIYEASDIPTREFEEGWTYGSHTTHVLRLEVGKRKNEGQIARDMKARREQ